MTIIVNQYLWVFDDVQLGIDLRTWRMGRKMTQAQAAEHLGARWTYGTVNSVERGRMTTGLPVWRLMDVCAALDADPRHYFVIERKS